MNVLWLNGIGIDAAIAKLQAENDRLRMELKLFQHRLAEDDGVCIIIRCYAHI